MPKLSLSAPACSHFLHHGKSYGCNLGGECAPATVELERLDKCPKYHKARRKGEPRHLDMAPLQKSKSVLITGGIGDLFAVESFLSVEERESIETIYYAAQSWRLMVELLKCRELLSFPRLRNHVAFPVGKTYYSLEEVVKEHGELYAADLSIGKVFPSERQYCGSSLLLYQLCACRKIDSPYVVIVPHSDWGQYEGRSFDQGEWQVLFEWLEERQLLGVVLYAGPKGIPQHRQLLNLTRQTSLAESLELLKGAQGYCGIDSCLSVLAAKLFPACRLSIKSVADYTYEWRHRYYAPHREFAFVHRTVIVPTWEE